MTKITICASEIATLIGRQGKKPASQAWGVVWGRIHKSRFKKRTTPLFSLPKVRFAPVDSEETPSLLSHPATVLNRVKIGSFPDGMNPVQSAAFPRVSVSEQSSGDVERTANVLSPVKSAVFSGIFTGVKQKVSTFYLNKSEETEKTEEFSKTESPLKSDESAWKNEETAHSFIANEREEFLKETSKFDVMPSVEVSPAPTSAHSTQPAARTREETPETESGITIPVYCEPATRILPKKSSKTHSESLQRHKDLGPFRVTGKVFAVTGEEITVVQRYKRDSIESLSEPDAVKLFAYMFIFGVRRARIIQSDGRASGSLLIEHDERAWDLIVQELMEEYATFTEASPADVADTQ